MFPRGRSSVFREAEALCTEEKKHRALPGVRVFYQKISRKIIEALCSVVFCKLWDICPCIAHVGAVALCTEIGPCIAHVGAVALCTEIGVSSVLQGDFLQKHRALRCVPGKLCARLQALCSVVFCKLWDICPCIAHVGASALCTEIGVSSVLQGDFLQKHRALLGGWGFVGGSIPEDSISSVYCVWWR